MCICRLVDVDIAGERALTDVLLPESLELPRQICVALCGTASSKDFIVAVSGCSIESEIDSERKNPLSQGEVDL